jgi:type I restriction enzyme S subunit
MEKYNSYKDSGIEWLGRIPEHWAVSRLKDTLSNSKYPIKTGPFGSQLKGNDLKIKGIYSVYSQRNVLDNQFESFKYFVDETKWESLSAFKVLPNDILITTRGTIGKASLVPSVIKKGVLHPCLIVIRPNKKLINFNWLLYYINESSIFSNHISYESSATTIEVIYSYTLKKLIQILPPIKEQTQIANYLDVKTKAIDKKVKLLKQKTKHYKAYRKTIINDTVTKGLVNNNSNWISCRLKDIGYLYSGLSGKSGDDFNQDENPNNRGFIPFTNIANNTYLNQNHLGTVVIGDNEKQNQVKKNDIFFLMSSEGYEDIGKSAVLIDDIKETYLNSFCKGFRITNNNCEASFINYLLLSDSYRQEMLVEGKGFTRINLKMEKVNNFSIIIPSTKKEQQQIVTYLNAKTTIIDNIVKNIEAQITFLKELRKTLINEIVTGRVKVSA